MTLTGIAGALTTRARLEEMDKADLVDLALKQAQALRQMECRVDHLAEARDHYRRMNQHHRGEMEHAISRAHREFRFRRILAREWAAAGRKVQLLSRSLQAMQLAHLEQMEFQRGIADAALRVAEVARSQSSGIGL